MRMNTRLLGASGGLVLLALLACIAPVAARADDTDPPGRVARLSDAEGSVSLQPAGVQEWSAATLNRPLTTGDRLWSDQNSRAELDLGAAVIRLGSSTAFSFLNLDDRTTQMQLAAGTLIVWVRDMQAGDNYEIDTPNVALSLQQAGEYRVEVNDRGDTTIAKVSEGAALATGGGQTVAITAQQAVRFTGTDTLAYDSATLGAPDDFDNWSAAREQQVADSTADQYVANDIPGTQDLDDNGQWQQTAEYGYVWMPTTVAADWAPYRFGHWAWISPWGWTWVDDAHWGYAPFHYGRWVGCNNSWCWVPGPRHGRPVYAPALVAWVGGPATGGSVAFGGNVGWFPLGPREVYVPGYRASPTYVRNVNITNTTIVNNTYITNVYQNPPAHYMNYRPAAVSVVPQSIFASGQRTGGHVVQLPAAALAGAAVMAAAPAIVPSHQSVLGPESHAAVKPAAAVLSRPVVARTPPPPAPASFDKLLPAIQANGGRPLVRADIAKLQPATPAAHVRVVAATGAVVAAGTLPHPGGTAPPASPPPKAAPSLTERERELQYSRLPPAPQSSAPHPPSTTVWSDEHPPSFQQHLPPTQQHAFTNDDPTHAYGHPSSIPVYHPPSATEAYVRAPESQALPTYHPAPQVTMAPAPVPQAVRPPAAVPPPVHVLQPVRSPPQPLHTPPPTESRDVAPHADRESRERPER
jgi:uncharacterized protein DUF6600